MVIHESARTFEIRWTLAENFGSEVMKIRFWAPNLPKFDFQNEIWGCWCKFPQCPGRWNSRTQKIIISTNKKFPTRLWFRVIWRKLIFSLTLCRRNYPRVGTMTLCDRVFKQALSLRLGGVRYFCLVFLISTSSETSKNRIFNRRKKSIDSPGGCELNDLDQKSRKIFGISQVRIRKFKVTPEAKQNFFEYLFGIFNIPIFWNIQKSQSTKSQSQSKKIERKHSADFVANSAI